MAEPKIPSAVRKKAKELLDSELLLDRLEPEFKKAEAKNKQLRVEMNQMLSDLGFPSITIDGIGRLTATFQGPYASIEKNEDGSVSDSALTALREWCEKTGQYDSIFRTSPNVQRISGLVKEALEGTGEMPPGVTHVLVKNVSLTRDKSLPAKTRK